MRERGGRTTLAMVAEYLSRVSTYSFIPPSLIFLPNIIKGYLQHLPPHTHYGPNFANSISTHPNPARYHRIGERRQSVGKGSKKESETGRSGPLTPRNGWVPCCKGRGRCPLLGCIEEEEREAKRREEARPREP